MSLVITDLTISAEDAVIDTDVSITVNPGELHIVMGPNGAGKSTLANALGGHPNYTVESGSIVLDKTDITFSKPEERAKAGLMLSMQHIPAIEGLTVTNFLRTAYNARFETKVNPAKFYRQLKELCDGVKLPHDVLKRHVGVGFSGGEKKRLEMVQLELFDPSYAILDETDSGLDVDALKLIAAKIQAMRKAGKGVLLITHHIAFLKEMTPDNVYIMASGKIVKEGDISLAETIETEGFESYG